MISVEEAKKIMNQVGFEPEIESVSIFEIRDRVLAEDIISKINMPPFNKSAMDGYAISSNDTSETFKIVEIISAGNPPKIKINSGECSKIMTGAAVPDGADKILKIELSEENDGYMTPTEEDNLKNICYLGEDIKKNDLVLSKGIKLNSSSIGVIASMGIKNVKVYKKPIVGLIITGTEIVEPGFQLKEGQIYNSNAYSLYVQLTEAGGLVNYAGIAKDDRIKTKEIILDTINNSDMIIISGGVSMGEFDYVPEILLDIGANIHFDRVSIKPGKPTTFGTIGKKVIFGLPGNPVAAFIITEVFVKELLYRMMGYNYIPFLIKGVLEKNYKRKKNDKESYIPVLYKDGIISFPKYHGPAHLGVLTNANALLCVPKGINEIQKNVHIDVRQLPFGNHTH